jgi:putative RNA 2'-phosphotransferase
MTNEKLVRSQHRSWECIFKPHPSYLFSSDDSRLDVLKIGYLCGITIFMADDLQISQRYVRISKYLSKHLRHQPERLGLELMLGGWIEVDKLLAAASANGFEISLSQLQQVVATNDKQRFAFSESGDLIRANQGHSIEIDLQLSTQTPPNTLYHGTQIEAITAILELGLQKMSRHHVHLTTDVKMAFKVGGRRGKSVILAIDTLAMITDGYSFYCTDNDVWLVDAVPPQYLTQFRVEDRLL